MTSFAAKNPRAGILASSDLKVWSLPNLTTPDVSSILWKTEDEYIPEIVVISVYSDINKATISSELLKAVHYCAQNQKPCIIGSDTNAHSILWGCNINNARGDDYEVFIAGFDLSVLNLGSESTFHTSRAQSIIDVSLAHYSLTNLVQDWHVSPEDFMSDHKCISFNIALIQPPSPSVLNCRRTDWNLFSSRMQGKGAHWTAPAVWDARTLDEEVATFTAEIVSAVTKSTPLLCSPP